MAEFEFDEIDRTLQALSEAGAVPPVGMERRVLEQAEIRAAETVRRRTWLSYAMWPVGTVMAAGLILVAMEHRVVKLVVDAPVAESFPEHPGDITPPFAKNAKDGAPAFGYSSNRPVATRHIAVREKLSTDVLGGALTHEEMLLVQMSRSNDAVVRESLDPEKREQNLADSKKQFEEFLNQGNETIGNTMGETL